MNKTRGNDLDSQLVQVLNKMLEEGFLVAPISRSTVQKRMKLKSRGTLGIGKRPDLIQNARDSQLKQAGISGELKKGRSLSNANDSLRIENLELKSKVNNLTEKLAMIINRLQARGLKLDEFLDPLRIKIQK